MAERVFTQTFGVVGAIIERAGKFLFVRESSSGKTYDFGKWSHPAGWIDVGENPSAAVCREVMEETGYVFTPTHFLGAYSLVRRDVEPVLHRTPHCIKLIYIGTISGEPAALHGDTSAIGWFTPNEIEAMDQQTLRDLDIKQMVRDYQAGQRYPLEAVRHTTSA